MNVSAVIVLYALFRKNFLKTVDKKGWGSYSYFFKKNTAHVLRGSYESFRTSTKK